MAAEFVSLLFNNSAKTKQNCDYEQMQLILSESCFYNENGTVIWDSDQASPGKSIMLVVCVSALMSDIVVVALLNASKLFLG